MKTIKGTFEVHLTGQSTVADILGQLTFAKEFTGPLNGKSEVRMLSAGDPSKAAGYVALEVFDGDIEGKKGRCVFMHKGTIDGGAQTLEITVAPGSGMDQLAGLKGALQIDIVDKQHFYTFDYALD